MANDLWGGGSGADDDDLDWNTAKDQRQDEMDDLALIAAAAKASLREQLHSPRSDGVYRATPIKESGVSGQTPRKRTGFQNAGKGRKPRSASMAGQSNAVVDGRQSATGAGLDGGHTFTDAVDDDLNVTGTVPTGRIRRSGATPTVTDRQGTRNIASEYKRPEFSRANVIASVKSLKFTTSGDLELVLTVPYEYRNEGQKFADAWGLEIRLAAERVKYGEDAIA